MVVVFPRLLEDTVKKSAEHLELALCYRSLEALDSVRVGDKFNVATYTASSS